MKVLLTSTSFQDTPGKHHELLKRSNWEIDYLRGPLKEEEIHDVIAEYDGLICGDDDITEEVIVAGLNGKLKAISKYGIGLDKIDIEAAKKFNLPIANTPGVNHIAVSEHAFMMLLAFFKNFVKEVNIVKTFKWERLIGHEIWRKKVAILGLGRIGQEMAKRCSAFGLDVWGYDISYDEQFMDTYGVSYMNSVKDLDSSYDIVSLHMPLTPSTKCIINETILSKLKHDVLIINTARADLVGRNALLSHLQQKKEMGYYSDVLWEEPINENEEIVSMDNVIITPHIGSRTYQSVERQGSAAVTNLKDLFRQVQK
jgi:D-3-phosphoglycerate dehydrogenase / 2-oxoglutarate reductase